MADEPIPGAILSTYTLQPEDVGRHVYCRVTGTNAHGSDVENSNIVGPITAGSGTPLTIFGTNLRAWYSADIGVTMSGSNVASVTDRSGNGATLTQTHTGAVTINATGVAGFPAFVLDDANDGLGTGATAVTTSATNVGFAFAMVHLDLFGSAANDRLLAFIEGAGPDYASDGNAVCFFKSTAAVLSAYRNGIATNLETAAEPPEVACFILVVWDGTDQKTFLNNVLKNSTACNKTWAAAGHLNLGYNGSPGALGLVAEFGFGNSSPTTTQLADLHAYFVDKYGIP